MACGGLFSRRVFGYFEPKSTNITRKVAGFSATSHCPLHRKWLSNKRMLLWRCCCGLQLSWQCLISFVRCDLFFFLHVWNVVFIAHLYSLHVCLLCHGFDFRFCICSPNRMIGTSTMVPNFPTASSHFSREYELYRLFFPGVFGNSPGCGGKSGCAPTKHLQHHRGNVFCLLCVQTKNFRDSTLSCIFLYFWTSGLWAMIGRVPRRIICQKAMWNCFDASLKVGNCFRFFFFSRNLQTCLSFARALLQKIKSFTQRSTLFLLFVLRL